MPALSKRRKLIGRPSFPLLVLLLGPALILFTGFVIVPVFQAAFFSLFKWNGLVKLSTENFRDVQNFGLLLSDPIFLKSLFHNLIIVIVSLVVEIPLALIVALIIGRSDFKLAILFRTFFFLPFVLSEIITGILWQFIYHPQFGLVKAFYGMFLPGETPPIILGNPDLVLGAIIIVIIWKYFGFHMSILIAGLQDISNDVKEAARIDGASELQTTFKIILPLLRPTILISVFFSIIGSFQVFDIVWAMGKGDPVNAADTMVTYLYKFGLQRMNIGYGSSVAVTIFGICLIFSIIYSRMVAQSERRLNQ